MKKLVLSFLCAFATLFAIAQVPKKVIVEHFTNTNCSVCGSRNPGFYSNLNTQKGVIHLAIHPSAPYPSCNLNKHNPTENDARTNFYGVYGGTPRLVIQGTVISNSTNYNNAAIFAPFLDQQTPASIRIEQTKFSEDSIQSKIIVKTEATHALGGLSLFVALVEDTVTYTGSNGEPAHFDVFRKAMTAVTGISLNLPTKIGDSLVFQFSSNKNAAWNFSRIYTLAILQETSTKAVVQAQSTPAKNGSSTGINAIANGKPNIQVFNTTEGLLVDSETYPKTLEILLFDLSGKEMLKQQVSAELNSINLATLPSGIYLYTLKTEDALLKYGKLIK